MRQNQYVFIVNPETGERKATYLVGVHGTLDFIMDKARSDYPGCIYKQGDDTDFNLFVGENRLYINGEYVLRPPHVPSEAELLATAKVEKMGTLQKLLSDTDYKAIKFAEGVMTEEEFAPIRANRQAWRAAYNAIEVANTLAEVNSITWPEA